MADLEESSAPRSSWSTLGDIAETFREMKAQGMTRGSLEYVLDQVYFD